MPSVHSNEHILQKSIKRKNRVEIWILEGTNNSPFARSKMHEM